MIPDLTSNAARTLLFDGLAQNDVDMAHHKLLNLDTSNLGVNGMPPTVHPPANQWLHDWDNPTQTWTTTQPGFASLSGNLTSFQQAAINQVGVIGAGTWQGSVIGAPYLPTLDAFRHPVAPLSMGGFQIKSLANPTDPQDAVNLAYLDSMLQGIRPKQAVRLASTSSVILLGTQTVDGKPTVAGDRILVKDQDSIRLAQNGIYIAGSGSWTRAPDCAGTNPSDPGHDINLAFCTVLDGTLNHGTKWVESAVVGTIGTDPVTFVLFTDASSGGAPGPQGPPGQGVPGGGLAGQLLAKVDGTDFNTHWVDETGFSHAPPIYAVLQTGQFNPVGTTGIGMMGLAGYITPLVSGKVAVTIAGYMYNDKAAGSAAARLCAGSGVAPVNGAPQPVGTSVLVGATAGLGSIGVNKFVPFSISAVISNLTPGIQFWFDILLQAFTTGTAIVAGVSVTAYEIP